MSNIDWRRASDVRRLNPLPSETSSAELPGMVRSLIRHRVGNSGEESGRLARYLGTLLRLDIPRSYRYLLEDGGVVALVADSDVSAAECVRDHLQLDGSLGEIMNRMQVIDGEYWSFVT